jgi:hypothetical protein
MKVGGISCGAERLNFMNSGQISLVLIFAKKSCVANQNPKPEMSQPNLLEYCGARSSARLERQKLKVEAHMQDRGNLLVEGSNPSGPTTFDEWWYQPFDAPILHLNSSLSF